MRRLLLAISFLTILPVRVGGQITADDAARSSGMFPLAGLVQGAIASLASYLLWDILPHSIVAALGLLVLVIINGGFHLDGLADTFDGIAARGDFDKKRSAMKDSAVGPMGLIAIVFALGIKYLGLEALAVEREIFISALILMPVLSRWAMTTAMLLGEPAVNEGLGSSFISNLKFRDFLWATILSVLIVAACAFMFQSHGIGLLLMSALTFPVLYALCVITGRIFKTQFGGLTGDTVGAVGELSEMMLILMLTVWLTGLY